MASLVSCAAGNTLILSSTCDFRTTKAELVAVVSLSKSVRRQQIGLGQEHCLFATVPAFNRRAPRLSSVSRKAGGAPGDDDEPTKTGE